MPKLKSYAGKDGLRAGVVFFCPGCKEHHHINVKQPDEPIWVWNGSFNAPTFTPSILMKSGHYVTGDSTRCWCVWNAAHPEMPSPFRCSNCHSYVTDGKIHFLEDSTHELSGQTVELPELV